MLFCQLHKHAITMTTSGFFVYRCSSSYQAFFQHIEEHFQIGELRDLLVLVMWSAVGDVRRQVESTRSVGGASGSTLYETCLQVHSLYLAYQQENKNAGAGVTEAKKRLGACSMSALHMCMLTAGSLTMLCPL